MTYLLWLDSLTYASNSEISEYTKEVIDLVYDALDINGQDYYEKIFFLNV